MFVHMCSRINAVKLFQTINMPCTMGCIAVNQCCCHVVVMTCHMVTDAMVFNSDCDIGLIDLSPFVSGFDEGGTYR